MLKGNSKMQSVNVSEIDWGLKPLQNKMLEMLSYVHEFCVVNGIDYCLAYGTALGAARHRGFIPWDDDVDIYMTSDSYKRFKDAFETKGDQQKYFFQELDPIDGMVTLTKLRMNGTTYIEPLYKDAGIHQGIYIDIFILHNAPDSAIKRKIMCFANQYLVLKGLSNRGYKEKKAYIPLLTFLRLFPKNFLRRLALKQIYKNDTKKTKSFFDNDLRNYNKSFYPSNIIFPAQTTAFEGVELCVPADLNSYLKWVYGNYNELPSYQDIKNSQHAAQWYVDRDYKSVIK